MPAPKKTPKNHVDLPPDILLKRKIPLSQASDLSNLSEDTLEREYPNHVLRISPRRKAMELGFVLSIGSKVT
jgi:hypothetical protein